MIPAANGDRHRQLTEILAEHPQLPVTLIEQQSLLAMEAADAVLLASGTTALGSHAVEEANGGELQTRQVDLQAGATLYQDAFASIPNLLAAENGGA